MSNCDLVHTEAACRNLVSYLYSKTRKLPVLVISQRRDCTGPVIKGPQLQDLLGPLAKVYTLSGGMLKPFNNLLDNFYGIEPTGVRLYLPRMSKNDPPGKHKVWNEYRIDGDYDAPEAFMETLRAYLQKRADHVANMASQNHPSVKEMTFAEAERLLFKKPTPAPKAVHPRVSGRKVLTVARPKPSQEALLALQEKFKAHA